jgi:hypothetical protein
MKYFICKTFKSELNLVLLTLFLGIIPLFIPIGRQQMMAAGKNSAGDEKVINRWSYLKYSIYFTSSEIDRLLVSPAFFEETMEYFAPVRPQKIYLELSNHNESDIVKVKKVSDKFRLLGLKTSGAMVPTAPNGPMCYNNPEHLASLEKRAKALAQVFDEIILDDWLFTICTCEKCVAGRGKSSWADYRTKLLLEKSKKYIIEPAKEVRPGVKVIIKYPNWYEGHRENGYDVLRETQQFDGMVAGIETRTRATHDQHIPIYSGYIFQKWWSSVDPQKWVGTWLDNYEMKGQENDYVAQVWQAVMANTPEIILWSGGNLHHTGPFSDVYRHFRDMLPEFNRIAIMLNGSARGVPIYLPYGSSGEYNIFGYLGMIGIPLQPVAEFPVSSQAAIFTKHSLKDPGLADKMISRLRNGKDVFMTWDLWLQLDDSEFENTLNLVDYGGSVSSSEFRTRIGWNQEITKTEKPFVFPRIGTTTWPYVRDVAVVKEDYDFAVFMRVPYLNGTIYILNMPENSYDLLRLPSQALNMIRLAFIKDLGVQLIGPGGVSMYLYGPKQYALYNMNDVRADLTLRFEQEIPASGWRELVQDRQFEVMKDTSLVRFRGPVVSSINLSLNPFEVAIIKAP